MYAFAPWPSQNNYLFQNNQIQDCCGIIKEMNGYYVNLFHCLYSLEIHCWQVYSTVSVPVVTEMSV